MIHLVLDGRCEQTIGSQLLAGAGPVRVAHDERRRPLDLDAHIRNGKAALLVHAHLAAERHDLGIDHRDRLLLLFLVAHVEDEQPARHADLHGREPHAGRVVHGFQHVVDQSVQLTVHVLDGGGGLTEEGIRQDDDRKFGHAAQIGNAAAAVNCQS